jgi:transcriptional regulator with XRE-family HTH domain
MLDDELRRSRLQKLRRLKELRERAMLSQEELAGLAGVSRATIAGLETGHRRARPATGRAIASALGVEPRVLLGEVGTERGPGPAA